MKQIPKNRTMSTAPTRESIVSKLAMASGSKGKTGPATPTPMRPTSIPAPAASKRRAAPMMSMKGVNEEVGEPKMSRKAESQEEAMELNRKGSSGGNGDGGVHIHLHMGGW